jgi:hypothetical protein
VGAALDAAIDEVLETMSDEQRMEPRFFPDNYQAWTEFFRRRYERELAAYDDPPPPPACNNTTGCRTLEAVLAHIEVATRPS